MWQRLFDQRWGKPSEGRPREHPLASGASNAMASVDTGEDTDNEISHSAPLVHYRRWHQVRTEPTILAIAGLRKAADMLVFLRRKKIGRWDVTL